MKPVAWRQSQLKQNNYPIEKVMAHFHEGIQLSDGLILYIQAKRPFKKKIFKTKLLNYTCKIHLWPLGRQKRP